MKMEITQPWRIQVGDCGEMCFGSDEGHMHFMPFTDENVLRFSGAIDAANMIGILTTIGLKYADKLRPVQYVEVS